MFQRGIDGPNGDRSETSEPAGALEQVRRAARSRVLATGTLACARCDAPVALGGAAVSPSSRLSCPFCLHQAPVRDFLSLAHPTRPARVTVRIAVSPRPAVPRLARSPRSG